MASTAASQKSSFEHLPSNVRLRLDATHGSGNGSRLLRTDGSTTSLHSANTQQHGQSQNGQYEDENLNNLNSKQHKLFTQKMANTQAVQKKSLQSANNQRKKAPVPRLSLAKATAKRDIANVVHQRTNSTTFQEVTQNSSSSFSKKRNSTQLSQT
jgi:hypothetical protein